MAEVNERLGEGEKYRKRVPASRLLSRSIFSLLESRPIFAGVFSQPFLHLCHIKPHRQLSDS